MSELRKFLQTFQNDKGETLDAHIENTLTRLLLKNPRNWFEAFEDESLRVKQKNFSLQNLEVDDNNNRLRENFKEVEEWGGKQMNALGLKVKKEGGEEEDGGEPAEEEAKDAQNVPNLLEDFKVWEQAGVHFGEEELFLLQKSLAKLSIEKDRGISFFGKILGAGKDYYVATAEARADDAGDEQLAPGTEPMGTGVNKQDFWVTNDVFSGWTRLPTISPRDIRESRRIKHIFTGDLSAKIYSSPPFSNTEGHLLKAMLARMFISTHLFPARQWKPTEDQEPPYMELEPFEDEVKKPTNMEMCQLGNWEHAVPHILGCGRCVHPEITDIDDEDKLKEAVAQQRARDPYAKRLKPATEDTQPKGLPCAWNVRQFGDQSYYPSNSLFKKPYLCHGSTVIYSLVWPGWMKAIHNRRHFNLYVGYGQKFTCDLQYRTLVHEVMDEPMGYPCCPEPTPLEEPVEQEKKDGEEAN